MHIESLFHPVHQVSPLVMLQRQNGNIVKAHILLQDGRPMNSLDTIFLGSNDISFYLMLGK